MPGLCDPEMELPSSAWRVTLVVAPISMSRWMSRLFERLRLCGTASALPEEWSTRASARGAPRSGCEPQAERVVASAGPELRPGCAAVTTKETPPGSLKSIRNSTGPRPRLGVGCADSAPSTLRCRAWWLVGFGSAAPALTRRDAGRSVPSLRGREGVSPKRLCVAAVGLAFGRGPVALAAADSPLDRVLSGTQAQGRIERG